MVKVIINILNLVEVTFDKNAKYNNISNLGIYDQDIVSSLKFAF